MARYIPRHVVKLCGRTTPKIFSSDESLTAPTVAKQSTTLTALHGPMIAFTDVVIDLGDHLCNGFCNLLHAVTECNALQTLLLLEYNAYSN